MINATARSANHQITGIDTTNDTLADRGGLAPLLRYVHNSGLLSVLVPRLAKLRASVDARDPLESQETVRIEILVQDNL